MDPQIFAPRQCDITESEIEDWLHREDDLIPDDEGFRFESLDDDDCGGVDPFGSGGFDFG
jgi:hypothetical protein